MIRVRIAQHEDIDKISTVLAASWKQAYRGIIHDDYLDSLKNDHWVDFLHSGLNDNTVFSMVLEADQEIIGAAILGKTEMSLISFYLLPNRIGQGFGHTFYSKIEAEIKRRGFSKCVLCVFEKNRRAISFYKAHGYIEVSGETITTLGEHNYICKSFEKAL